jgi:pimeloyl-ACP methyl ester carboxylesterase
MTATPRVLLLAGFLFVAAGAGGCQTSSTPPQASSQPTSARLAVPDSASPARQHPASVDGCFTPVRGTIETVPDTGGGRLTLAIIGTGPRVVVLSNQSNEDLCSWLPFSRRLAAAGYRVVLWDYGSDSPADELTGLVKRLHSTGAARLVLMGASEGAKASLVAAARTAPMVQGVVSLSAEFVLTPGIVVADFVKRLHCPLLVVTADEDPYDAAAAAQQYMATAPAPVKQLVTVPGTDHGTDLLSGRSGAKTIPAIVAFLGHVLD